MSEVKMLRIQTDRFGLGSIARSLNREDAEKRRRKLSISGPKVSGATSNHLKSTFRYPDLFLDVLYDFERSLMTSSSKDASAYLNVYQGETVQLVKAMDNNLIEVKLLSRVGQGLIPLRCVSVNTALSNPRLAAHFLHGTKWSHPSGFENPSEKAVAPKFDPKNLKASSVVDIKVSHNRVWYRVDCEMHSGDRFILCRFFQDFYALQLLLVRMQRQINSTLNLPALPDPTRSLANENIKLRCKEFSEYIRVLMALPFSSTILRDGEPLGGFLAPRSGDLRLTSIGALFTLSKMTSSSYITIATLPPSKIELAVFQNLTSKFAVSMPRAIGAHKSQQRSQARSMMVSSSQDVKINKIPSVSSAPSTPVMRNPPIFSSHTETSDLAINHKELVKVKILYHDDCYAIKCQVSEIDNLEKLRALISAKLFSDFSIRTTTFTISHISDHGKIALVTDNSVYQRVAMSVRPSLFVAFNTTPDLGGKNRRLIFRVHS
ncbi:LAMI_0H02432g1_1 [Lachancea mirantina]|uniref:LAMI_0H02432g1_1 n=1 Tax=Lachancea mirantina TaxID=1230905 RepID=A0A1G4KDZ8_9SACH|nr:LAMI_0H02432g1_1 [Lachancea mirantina]